jgi:hypothetical protein
MDEMRKAIAAAMTRAKQTIPHFYLSETIDVQPAIRLPRQPQRRASADDRVLLGALFVRATALPRPRSRRSTATTWTARFGPPGPSMPASPWRCAVAGWWRPR